MANPSILVGDENKIMLPARSVLFQTAQSLSANIEVAVYRKTTRAEAVKAVAESLQTRNDETFISLLKTPRDTSRSLRLYERTTSTSRQPLAPLVIRTPNDGANLPAPNRPSMLPAAREARRKTLRQAEKFLERDPYPTNLEARIWEESLMSLPTARFVFAGIEPGIDEPVSHVVDQPCIWDTGAHITTISDDLLNGEFRSFIHSPEYDTYHRTSANGDSWVVSVDGVLQFSNTALEVEFVAKVIPRERMPNGFSGILLGQCGLINTFEYQATPRLVLEGQGDVIPENVWGDLVLLRHYDAVAEKMKIL